MAGRRRKKKKAERKWKDMDFHYCGNTFDRDVSADRRFVQ